MVTANSAYTGISFSRREILKQDHPVGVVETHNRVQGFVHFDRALVRSVENIEQRVHAFSSIGWQGTHMDAALCQKAFQEAEVQRVKDWTIRESRDVPAHASEISPSD
jgi:hypothetical protein